MSLLEGPGPLGPGTFLPVSRQTWVCPLQPDTRFAQALFLGPAVGWDASEKQGSRFRAMEQM